MLRGDFLKNLKGFSIILIVLFLGELIQRRFDLIVPGTVLGMLVFLLLLIFNIIKLEWIDSTSKILLDNMTLFFVPISIGVISVFSDIKDIWLELAIILLVSTIVVMVVTGLTVQFLNKYMGKNEKRER